MMAVPQVRLQRVAHGVLIAIILGAGQMGIAVRGQAQDRFRPGFEESASLSEDRRAGSEVASGSVTSLQSPFAARSAMGRCDEGGKPEFRVNVWDAPVKMRGRLGILDLLALHAQTQGESDQSAGTSGGAALHAHDLQNARDNSRHAVDGHDNAVDLDGEREAASGRTEIRREEGGSGYWPLGLTISRFSADLEVTVRAMAADVSRSNGAVRGQQKGTEEFCVWPAAVVIDIGFREREILIAREVGVSRCLMAEVIQHEKRHVRVEDILLEGWLHDLYDAIDQRLVTMEAVMAGSIEEGLELIQKDLLAIIAEQSAEFERRRDEAHARIDTQDEYHRLSRACNGAASRLVRGIERKVAAADHEGLKAEDSSAGGSARISISDRVRE